MSNLTLSGLDVYQPSRVLVENGTGGTIYPLTAVRLNGMGMRYPQVIVNSSLSPVFGIVGKDILTGAAGIVTTLGFLSDVDTSAWPVNSNLYADIAGHLSTTPFGDYAPVAIVLKQDSYAGILFVTALSSQYTGEFDFSFKKPDMIYVAPYGDDVNGDGSYPKPYHTIAKALIGANPNAAINLFPGSYFEPTVVLPANITIIGTSQGSVNVTNGFSYVAASGDNVGINLYNIGLNSLSVDTTSCLFGLISVKSCSGAISTAATANPNCFMMVVESNLFGDVIHAGSFSFSECLVISSPTVTGGLVIYENSKMVQPVLASGASTTIRMLDCEMFGPSVIEGVSGSPTWEVDLATDYLGTSTGVLNKVLLANTASLDTFIGDSGSGGVRGLVPAPGAGDALAGKFLSANGTFAVPPGSAQSGALAYFFSNTASDISTYLVMGGLPGGSEAYITDSSPSNGKIVQSWATILGTPGVSFIPGGLVHFHIHGYKSGGTKDVALYGELYKRTALGIETLIATTGMTDLLTTVEQDLPAVNTVMPDIILDSTDRLVLKIVESITGPGSVPPNITIGFAGLTGTRIEIPSVAAPAITALTGDVTATGPGSVVATVNTVGGSSAVDVHSAELLANAATNLNTISTIVKRDSSGNFSAGVISADLTGNVTGTASNNELLSNKSNDTALTADSSTLYPTQHAVKTYIDALVVPSTNEFFVAKNGNDTTGNGSKAKPFLTIQAAATAVGTAANSADYEATAKRFWAIRIGNGVYTENVTIGTRMVVVFDFSSAQLVGNVIVNFDKGIAAGATTRQPKYIFKDSDLRPSFTGSNLPLSGVNGNVNWNYTNGGSSVTCEIHLIHTGVSGNIVTALGTGGTGNGVLQVFAVESYITGQVQITSGTGSGSLFFDSMGDDTAGLGGATGNCKLQMLRNVRFSGPVSVSANHGGAQWYNVSFAASSSFTGSSGSISSDSNSYASYFTNASTKGSETFVFLDDVKSIAYTPTTPTNWSSVPTNAQQALDILSGTTITSLTGDVVATGPGAAAATIQANVVGNSKLAQMVANTIKGNNTGSTANPLDLTTAQVAAMLPVFTGDSGAGGIQGLVPAPASGTRQAGDFLSANGSWSYVDQSKPIYPIFSIASSTSAPVGNTKFENITTYTGIDGYKQYAAVVAGGTNGTLFIWDITDPAIPVCTSYIVLSGAYNIIVTQISGAIYALVPSSGASTFYIVNITNPYSLSITATKPITGSPGSLYAIAYANGYVYLATQAKGLTVLDIGGGLGGGTITAPVQTYQEGGTLNKSAGIALVGNTLYTTNYQTTFPATVRYLKTWTLTGAGTAITPSLVNTFTVNGGPTATSTKPGTINLSPSGNTAYVMDNNQNVCNVIDVTTPTSPSYLTYFTPTFPPTGNGLSGVVPSGNFLYVPSGGDVTNGGCIDIFDVTTPSTPLKVKSLTTGVSTQVFGGIALNSGYIYVANYGIGLGTSSLDAYSQAQLTPTFGLPIASNIQVQQLSANTALVSNANKQLASSATTATELSYVHGVTSAIQTQLNSITSSAVTSVAATSPLQSSGGLTPSISFINQTANTVLAGPVSGSPSTPTFRSLVRDDVPLPNTTTKTSNYTITNQDDILFCDTISGPFTLTLPSPTGQAGRMFTIIDSTGSFVVNNLTLAPSGSEKIEGVAASKVLQTTWAFVRVLTNGVDWFIGQYV